MAKIVLHIGAPKTATTTLQNWFFYALHQKGMINYLGKVSTHVVNDDPFKQLKIDQFNTSVSGDRGDSQSLNKCKEELNALIDENKINVLSEERFSSEAPYRDWIPFAERIKRLKFLLQGHSVTVLYVLRRQSEHFYSQYVEIYPLLRHVSNDTNTIAKFYADITSCDPQKKKFYERTVFQYSNACREYKKEFGEVHCLFFEELLENEFSFYQKIATLLNITMTQQDIPTNKSNVRQKSEQGYISYPHENELRFRNIVLLGHRCFRIPTKNTTFYRDLALVPICDFLPRILYYLFVHYNILFSASQKNKLKLKQERVVVFLWGLFLKATVHPYFTEQQKQCILALCKESNQMLVKEHFCTMQDLKKQGYL